MSLSIKITNPKKFEDVQENVKAMSSQGLNKDIGNGITQVRTGTVTTGDPTTDLIIGDLRTAVNAILTNILKQL